MKTLISAIILSTLPFGASATSCEAIGKSIVDQYSSAGGFHNDTSERKTAYENLVEAHVKACRAGVDVRKRGLTAQELAQVVETSYATPATVGSFTPVISKSMTITSYTQGYAFGE
ncbi:MAG: hypothetical protein [Caudoviricetes sp.]|nr:MAG: hypothetical protein [Caudoviricetes sp.]